MIVVAQNRNRIEAERQTYLFFPGYAPVSLTYYVSQENCLSLNFKIR